jgi:hypothetical protein
MSQELFSLNQDLARLREEGYFVEIRGGLLLMREVPYVDSHRKVRTGTLVSTLTLAGNLTRKPDTHVIHWHGEFPCRADGRPLSEIASESRTQNLGHGVTIQHSFSSKPNANGYPDYYAKMSTYASILAGPATTIQPGISPRVFPPVDDTCGVSAFNYLDTASDRVGIGHLTLQLENDVISLVGVGGTGSYILDLIAKTPVREIRLFDDDEFLQHNAFRAPGAPSLAELRDAPKKVDYLHGIYSRMHRGIVPNATKITDANMSKLDGTTFAFICMDAGDAKLAIVRKLESLGVPFIDVGMGLELVDGSLGGILRVTTSTPECRSHFYSGKVSFLEGGEKDLYASNIQVADLNALNACLAVLKWKKLRGFYRDLDHELHSTFTTDGNLLLNEKGEEDEATA